MGIPQETPSALHRSLPSDFLSALCTHTQRHIPRVVHEVMNLGH